MRKTETTRATLSRFETWSRMLVLVASLLAAPVGAAEIVVTSAMDVLNLDGRCSLREAVLSANTDTAINDCTAGSGADVILLTAGIRYELTIAGLNEDLAQTGDLDILWHTTIRPMEETGRAVIDALGTDRVFQVLAGAFLTLDRVELSNGAGNPFGGAVVNFDPVSELHFFDVNINNSVASLRGGAVATVGPLVWNDGAASNNQAAFGGAVSIEAGGSFDGFELRLSSNDAVGGDGGDIYAFGPVSCERCSINTGEARDGGGVYMEDDHLLTLRSSEMIGSRVMIQA